MDCILLPSSFSVQCILENLVRVSSIAVCLALKIIKLTDGERMLTGVEESILGTY